MLKVNKGILRALELCDGSQVVLAQKLGLTKQRISKVIRYSEGGCPPNLRDQLIEAFNIPISDFKQFIVFDCNYLTRNIILNRLLVECN